MRGRVLAGAVLGALACLGIAPSFGADPAAGGVPATQDAAAEIAVQGAAGTEARMTAGDLAALPSVRITVATEPGHGPAQRSFEGPLLWTVLARAGAIDPAGFRDQVRQSVLLTGRDGYTALLGLGEISPEFEGKQAVLALRMDGAPIPAEHLRLVVPGDKRGGRGVHDLVRIAVLAPPAAAPSSAR